jgi:hypothetical protein|tara:strand:+ start:362 stop:625 length:264 start_codon:yes stop_codon:yes gene_type:complete
VKALVSVNSSGPALIEDLIVDGLPFDPRKSTQPFQPLGDANLPPGQIRPQSGGTGSSGVDEFIIGVNGDICNSKAKSCSHCPMWRSR